MIKVAINGFGRIGRLVLRALLEKKNSAIQVVAINDLSSLDLSAHLFKYDSVHGTFQGSVEGVQRGGKNYLKVESNEILVLSEPNPENLPWQNLDIDIVFECSGRFTKREKAAAHLNAGAKRVLISAPGENVDSTIVYGVNEKDLDASQKIVSNASCTTNCLAPIAKVLHEKIGILQGFMTTIHAYTGDQSLVDSIHQDPRRARAAALSMIPTSTGAAKAVGLVLPALKGKLDGTAIRVPTANVSLIDLTFVSMKDTSVEEIHTFIEESAKGPLKGVLEVNKAPLVSIDFNHCPASSVFDVSQTSVIEKRFCRILAWYDNEWGFSNRMADVALVMAKFL